MKMKLFVVLLCLGSVARATEAEVAVATEASPLVIHATEAFGGRWCITGEQEDPPEGPQDPPPDCVPGE